MSLYIRVLTSFYTHRKTLRLKLSVGNDAFWIPPRLWAYAASNQPDGIFEDYTPEELALLLGYTGNAQAMLQALIDTGFVDRERVKIHDWEEHNGVHSVFAERARSAARARWDREKERTKEREGKTRQDKTRQEPSIAKLCLSNASSNASSMTNAKNWPESRINELIDEIGAKVFRRPAGQAPTYVEQVSGLGLLDRPNLQTEKETILTFAKTCRPEDRRFYIPQTLHALFDLWSETLDKARNYKPHENNRKPNSRNAGVAVGPTDYGEAAKRKLERQALEAKNRESSET